MGWERKRGKLQELNALFRGSTTTSFLTSPGPRSRAPAGVRYVVTLDADTRLPRGVVGRLVGTMAHPLNQPSFDARLGRVTHGYGLLQPRITPTLPEREDASIFQRVFAGSAGIDPYATAVSDVYQDLFQEGSFTGKGIYDVDAFASAMHDRVPDNTLLSHDLFEGVFARAGLVTDVELFDEFPSDYLVASARQHRWARGDWQLLPWILGGRRGNGHARAWARIGGVGRWKMLDNLRRTLTAPLALATLVAAWTIESASAGWWTALVVASVVLPPALPVVAGLIPRRRGISKRSHVRDVGSDVVVATAQVMLDITFLAHQAWLMVDAIVRTLARLLVTRRAPARVADRGAGESRPRSRPRAASTDRWRAASGSPPSSVCSSSSSKPDAAWIAAPFVVLWLAAPWIARQISLPGADLGTGRSCPIEDVDVLASSSPVARGCSSRPSSPPTTTGCRRTTSRTTRNRWSPIARRPPTSACTCWPPSAPATSVGSARSTWSNGSRPRWPPSIGSNDSTVISTTGTTRRRCSGWSPSTSRRSTAATSPAICSPCPTPVAR